MNHFERDEVLETFSILCDTREQQTEYSRRRYKAFGVPYTRAKLDYGDYAAQCIIDGKPMHDIRQSIKAPVVIERKMNLDELAQCFTHSRDRFEREFKRAKKAKAKVYLLVEDANWENLIAGKYRSRMHPAAFLASILAWQVRYDLRVIFCKKETSGRMIKEILFRELKEELDGKDV